MNRALVLVLILGSVAAQGGAIFWVATLVGADLWEVMGVAFLWGLSKLLGSGAAHEADQ